MNTLNKEIRSLEMTILDRRLREGEMFRRIGFLMHGRSSYREELKHL